MTFLLLFLWILVISSFSFIGAGYVKIYGKSDALIGIYVAFVIISNVLAVKIGEFDLGFYTFFAPVATLVFSITFLLTDIVNEKFGRKETHKMIFIAFIAQIITSLVIFLSINLTPAPFWNLQDSFKSIFGFAPRIMIASWIAFLISENFDAIIFSIFKKFTNGKHLWMRNIFSSIPSMTLDTGIFVILAFFGVQPLIPLIVGVVVLKYIVGIINIPFMYLNRFIVN